MLYKEEKGQTNVSSSPQRYTEGVEASGETGAKRGEMPLLSRKMREKGNEGQVGTTK